MPIVLNGTTGITTPTYNGSTTAEYLVPVTGFKNRIINGAMVIDQRNAGASVTPSADGYLLDRWLYEASAASKFTFQQNAGSVTPPVGFTKYLGATVASAVSITSNSYFMLEHRIEGQNLIDLAWGTANAKTVTLSFKVYSSLTGTFGGCIGNASASRSYPFSYTISSANTWTDVSITIAGDTTGTWLTTNGIGMVVYFGLGVGSTYSGTAGAWAGANYNSATGATSVVGTNGATFYITGVQLEVGSTATSFDYRPYGTELALCQRYFYQVVRGAGQILGLVSFWTATDPRCVIKFPVSMRANPSVISTSGSGFYDIYRNGGSASTNGPFGNAGAITTEMASIFDTSSASTGTAGQAGWLQTATSSAAISFSAEL
jgi:hypothetical protein